MANPCTRKSLQNTSFSFPVYSVSPHSLSPTKLFNVSTRTVPKIQSNPTMKQSESNSELNKITTEPKPNQTNILKQSSSLISQSMSASILNQLEKKPNGVNITSQNTNSYSKSQFYPNINTSKSGDNIHNELSASSDVDVSVELGKESNASNSNAEKMLISKLAKKEYR